MRPATRRSEPNDLETARRVVSRAERQALDKAERLRREAEELLKAASSRTTDALTQARKEVAEEVTSLRAEMESASKRATAAEGALEAANQRAAAAEAQIERLQAEHEEELALISKHLDAAAAQPATSEGSQMPALKSPDISTFDDSESFFSNFMTRMSEDTQRLVEAATQAAARMHSQAEAELAEAKIEAGRITAAARKEAEDLLTKALAAIDRDTKLSENARIQAEKDATAAAEAKSGAESHLATVRQEGDKLMAKAQAEADRLVAAAQAHHDQLMSRANSVVEDHLGRARNEFAQEVAGLRKYLDDTRTKMDQLLTANMAKAGDPDAAKLDLREQSKPPVASK